MIYVLVINRPINSALPRIKTKTTFQNEVCYYCISFLYFGCRRWCCRCSQSDVKQLHGNDRWQNSFPQVLCALGKCFELLQHIGARRLNLTLLVLPVVPALYFAKARLGKAF